MSDFQPVAVPTRFTEAMRVLFPIADGTSNYLVTQTDSGLMLVAWNLPNDVPSSEEVSAALVTADWNAVRAKRDALLSACDYTQRSDNPLPDDQRAAWATYRQALRNLPETYASPDAVIWPTVP